MSSLKGVVGAQTAAESHVNNSRELGTRFNVYRLNEVGHVHGHLLNGSIVELLDIAQGADVLFRHEIDSNAFTAKSSTTANSERE